MQSYGGPWTLLKLEIVERYLDYYARVMKNQSFKLCYIDAFAGSGNVEIKGGEIPGSALRALDYPFNRYIFIEKEKAYLRKLQETVITNYSGKECQFIHGDCNELLEIINKYNWYKNNWRGVIFLDPYAMNLKWTTLHSIVKTKVFDVWYLFPLSALNRNLYRDGRIPSSNKKAISALLGTDDWEKKIYRISPQGTLFGEIDRNKLPITEIGQYVIKRLETEFAGVSKHAKLLKNPETNSPLFLLCFAVSNPSKNAINRALTGADYILTHVD
jgi:three-Cys-motif partner protein